MVREVKRGDLLMLMAQNASVETVTVRTHKMVKNDFMLGTWWGYIDNGCGKEHALVRERGLKGIVMRLLSANTWGISSADETWGERST